MTKNKAIFLDRDGTINIDKDYLYRPSDFEFIDGAVEGLRLLQNVGYKLIIITNQSGIARGYYTEEQYHALDIWLKQTLKSNGITIEDSYFCPHLPLSSQDEVVPPKLSSYRIDCDCRKPKLGMFQNAVADHNIDLSTSFAIGDRLRDLSICCNTSVNSSEQTICRGYLINTTEPQAVIESVKNGKYPNIKYQNNLLECAEKICAGFY